MDFLELRDMEYEKCAGLLAELLNLGADAKEKMHNRLQSMGMGGFLLNVESLGLPPVTIEKLRSVKDLIEIYGIQRGRA